MMRIYLLLSAVAASELVPVFDNTCWDNDPATPCPVSAAANARYTSLAMLGGKATPAGVTPDSACVTAERNKANGGSNTSQCLAALRARKVEDDKERSSIKCEKTAFLAHTWWDGPLVRVVQLFLRSFRSTQHPQCAKLVVWTPGPGTERSTPEAAAMCAQVEAMTGAPVVFQTLHMEAMAVGTLFEDYVKRAILVHDWSTQKPGDKKEGTRHFSDFFQLFVLWRYGGVYFDADQVLLRDMFPLYGLNFEYQWSFIPEKFNNAVQGLGRGEGERLIRHGGKLNGDGCCKGWGNTLWTAKVMKLHAETYGLPCTAWDPFWLRMDGHHTGEMQRPSLTYPEPVNRNWLFGAPYSGDWYDGAFGIHWHGGAGGSGGGDTNAWTPKIKDDSFFAHWEGIYS